MNHGWLSTNLLFCFYQSGVFSTKTYSRAESHLYQDQITTNLLPTFLVIYNEVIQFYPPFYIINLFAPIFVGSISVLFIIKLPSLSSLLFFIFLRFVLRGGEWGEISSEDLVPGDVVSLKAIVQKKQSKNYRFYDFE